MRIPVTISGIQADAPEDDPIVMLKEKEGTRLLPLWIGESEAELLLFALENTETPRPLTHDLLLTIMERLGETVIGVAVTAEREGIFWAELMLSNGKIIDCRPSDALIVAAKLGCEILVESDLLSTLSIEASTNKKALTSDDVDEFRRLLDTLSADDFLDSGSDGDSDSFDA